MSPKSPDPILVAQALDALECALAASLDFDLAADPALRARYERVRARCGLGWWFAGTSSESARCAVLREARLGEEPIRPHERLSLHVAGIDRQDERRVVALALEDSEWVVVLPVDPRQDRRLSELPPDGDGFLVAVKARGTPGLQRWVLAFPPVDLQPDWELPPEERWSDAQSAIAEGNVPFVSFEVTAHALEA